MKKILFISLAALAFAGCNDKSALMENCPDKVQEATEKVELAKSVPELNAIRGELFISLYELYDDNQEEADMITLSIKRNLGNDDYECRSKSELIDFVGAMKTFNEKGNDKYDELEEDSNYEDYCDFMRNVRDIRNDYDC